MAQRRKRTSYDADGARGTMRVMAETNSRLAAAVERLGAIIERLIGRGPDAPSLPENTARPLPPLTARELEVARLICEALSTRQIAERLTLEPATVKTHRRSIARKCGASDRHTLTAKRQRWDYPGE